MMDVYVPNNPAIRIAVTTGESFILTDGNIGRIIRIHGEVILVQLFVPIEDILIPGFTFKR